MEITNKYHLPEAIVKACSTEQHNKPGCLSATTLLKGTKQIILEERHWEELKEDVSDRIWALWGTTVHSFLEHEGKNEFTEVSVETKVDDITVTGRIDNYNMETGIVTDWKTASVWKVTFADFSDWRMQGILYLHLLRKNGFPANGCRFVALLKDHSKTKASRDRSYPQEPVYVFEHRANDEELTAIEDFVNVSVRNYKKALLLPDAEIPECVPTQRWESPAKYAVMKPGRKSAVKLFDEAQAALSFADTVPGGYVDERLGRSVRCENYCSVNQFCNFYKEKIEPTLAKEANYDTDR